MSACALTSRPAIEAPGAGSARPKARPRSSSRDRVTQSARSLGTHFKDWIVADSSLLSRPRSTGCSPTMPPTTTRTACRSTSWARAAFREGLLVAEELGPNRDMSWDKVAGHSYPITTRAGAVNLAASAHWLRHAHASHAIDNGAPVPSRYIRRDFKPPTRKPLGPIQTAR